MYRFFRPFLFKSDPEMAHQATIQLIRLAGKVALIRFFLSRIYSAPQKQVKAFGLEFANPVGLAAGYDKDGLAWRGLACLGFGHIEIGTVTPRPQPGNKKPRVFRLVEDEAIINRMGFPGRGAEFVVTQIAPRRPGNLILGVNIGKNKDTPLESAVEDYIYLLRRFAHLADYIAINVSSPNTIDLRRLQARDALDSLLKSLAQEREILSSQARRPGNLPILVKLAPDLDDDELDDAMAAVHNSGIDGIIATNTTLSRDGLHSLKAVEIGGLSGAPLAGLSREMVEKITRRSGGTIPVIGVGGIMNSTDAQSMLDAGAVLVQVYTGLIYTGPVLVKQILTNLQ